ncbi:hypothetical protein NV226_02075 [Mycoplasma iguanae]|uniref:Uncharacterized protein n=1 Tax=Mycoplasma iguanae TaxID=292461 RepID=A0ABY5R9Q2_9MOLU|nr:hypothetical protein [Mycoplasma iguanae]UVD81502.1 hypothetical protein NV226_02075 [Mycoplasma iguanae]
MKKKFIITLALISTVTIFTAGLVTGLLLTYKHEQKQNITEENNKISSDSYVININNHDIENNEEIKNFLKNIPENNSQTNFNNAVIENRYKNAVSGTKESVTAENDLIIDDNADKNEVIQKRDLPTLKNRDDTVNWLLKHNAEVKTLLKEVFLPKINYWYEKIVASNQNPVTLINLIRRIDKFQTNDVKFLEWKKQWFLDNSTQHIIGLQLLSNIAQQINVVNSLFNENQNIINADIVYFSNDDTIFDLYTNEAKPVLNRYLTNPNSITNQTFLQALENIFKGHQKSFYDYHFFLFSPRKEEYLNNLDKINNNLNGHTHAITNLVMDLIYSLEFFFKYWEDFATSYQSLNINIIEINNLMKEFQNTFKNLKSNFYNPNFDEYLFDLKNEANKLFSDFILTLPLILEIWKIEKEAKSFFKVSNYLYQN